MQYITFEDGTLPTVQDAKGYGSEAVPDEVLKVKESDMIKLSIIRQFQLHITHAHRSDRGSTHRQPLGGAAK